MKGLDLPEVSLVAVLDADKEGFLRSETTLIQVCGRAARNVNGRVILYADRMTGSMDRAIKEMDRRRKKQLAYNEEHHITPQTIHKSVQELEEFQVQVYGAHVSRLFIDEKSLCSIPSGFQALFERSWKCRCVKRPITSNSSWLPLCAIKSMRFGK